MSGLLDHVREKYKPLSDATDKTDKRASVSSVGPQDKASDSFGAHSNVVRIPGFDRERAGRDIARRASERDDRRQRVLSMLDDAPLTMRYVCLTDDKADREHVIVTFAVRGIGSGELVIERARYDAFRLLALLPD